MLAHVDVLMRAAGQETREERLARAIIAAYNEQGCPDQGPDTRMEDIRSILKVVDEQLARFP